jgi:hypothetical protein
MTLEHRSHREIIGIAHQAKAALGTPTDPVTHLVPVTSFQANEAFEQITDNGRRGPDAMDFRAVQGVKFSEISIEGLVQMNGTTGSPIGMFLRNLLGTGAAASSSPYLTPIQIGSTGVYKHYRGLGQTSEYLNIQHYDRLVAANFREFEGCRVTSMTISWNAGEGVVTYSVNLVGRNFTKETDTMQDLSAQDVTLEDPFAGWRASVVLNGVSNTNLISSEWNLSRSDNRLYTGANTQLFKALYLGPLEVTVAMVFDYSATELDLFKAGTQVEVTNLFEYGTSGTLRGFGIAGEEFSLLESPASVDSSAEQLTLALSARGLYTTQNGPIATDKSDTFAQNGPIETLTEEVATGSY